jgi:hypothetical protein
MLILACKTAQCHNPESHRIAAEASSHHYHDCYSFRNPFQKKDIVSADGCQPKMLVVTAPDNLATVVIA